MILVEGLDLAGKSTLVQNLQTHFEEQGITVRVANGQLCPQNPIANVARELVRWDEGFTGLEAGATFLASHLWDLRHYQPPAGGTLHLQDSCWLRSLAFERVIGQAEVARFMEQTYSQVPPVQHAIMLTASLEARAARFKSRAKNDLHDLMAFRRPERFLKIERELAWCVGEFAGGVVLDTSGLDQDEVLVAALEVIQSESRAA